MPTKAVKRAISFIELLQRLKVIPLEYRAEAAAVIRALDDTDARTRMDPHLRKRRRATTPAKSAKRPAVKGPAVKRPAVKPSAKRSPKAARRGGR